MKYFYAGNTAVRGGNNVQFCGVWANEDKDLTPTDIMQAIIAYKREELGKEEIALTALNVIAT